MKIAVITSKSSSIPKFRQEMIEAFVTLGHEVVVIGDEYNDEWVNYFDALGVEYRTFPVNNTGTNPIEDLNSLRHLRTLLQEIKPDKIFSYLVKANLYTGMALKGEKKPEFYPLVAGLGSVLISNSIRALPLRAYINTSYRIAIKKARKVFFQNRDDEAYFIDKNIVSDGHTQIINGSGVNLEHFTFTKPPHEPVFLFIGRLIKDKGIIEYLEAARELKKTYSDARFLLAGPYSTNPSAIEPRVLQEYIDSGVIEYYGEVPDAFPLLKRCSVFVLPSYAEGTPKSVLEAMSTGRMIITTDAPGCRDTVEEGVNGILVQPRDTADLSNAMEKAYLDQDLRSIMGSNSRRIAEEKYDVNLVVKTIVETMGL